MKKYLLISPMVPLLAFAALPAWSQIIPPPEVPDVGPGFLLEVGPVEPLNKISLNYRMGFNISVDFRNLGGISPAPILFSQNRSRPRCLAMRRPAPALRSLRPSDGPEEISQAPRSALDHVLLLPSSTPRVSNTVRGSRRTAARP